MAIVAISRGTRSGGAELAHCLAARLGYTVLGREVIQPAATRIGASEKELARAMERAPRRWSRQSTQRRLYVIAVRAALAEYVVDGNLVYHGLAGQLLLRGVPALLRVRLIAPLEQRIDVHVREDGLSRVEAVELIEREDEERRRWVRMMYDERIDDPALYDVVVNLETATIPAACALLAAGVSCRQFEISDEVRGALDDFRLACRVKLALIADPDTRPLSLEATAHAGAVEITGHAPLLASGRTGDRVAAVAGGVPGVHNVFLKLSWYDPYP